MNIAIRSSQIVAFSSGSNFASRMGVVASGWPTEKINVPPTGWPSDDTTRQLSACVP
jgi:hypothetical protein